VTISRAKTTLTFPANFTSSGGYIISVPEADVSRDRLRMLARTISRVCSRFRTHPILMRCKEDLPLCEPLD